jgi:hypothetical protein
METIVATLKQAEAARTQFADDLAKLGAHAIGVEESEPGDGWAVIAYVAPEQQIAAPATLVTTVGGKVIKVPLRIRREEAFKLE